MQNLQNITHTELMEIIKQYVLREYGDYTEPREEQIDYYDPRQPDCHGCNIIKLKPVLTKDDLSIIARDYTTELIKNMDIAIKEKDEEKRNKI